MEKKLVRINKAEAGSWEENNPYLYYESDLKWCLKDLEAAKEALAKYQAELQAIQEKAASRNVVVILEFLEQWKEGSRKYYTGPISPLSGSLGSTGSKAPGTLQMVEPWGPE